jgi:hypothetical protein
VMHCILLNQRYVKSDQMRIAISEQLRILEKEAGI